MKIDLQIAMILTRVNGFSDLVLELIEEGSLKTALLFLQEELDAYEKAQQLLKTSTSKIFIDFFSDWLPTKVKDVHYAISRVEELLYETTSSQIQTAN
jgi:hypothetical protein